MNKKNLIPIIVILILGVGVVVFKIVTKELVVNKPVDPVVEEMVDSEKIVGLEEKPEEKISEKKLVVPDDWKTYSHLNANFIFEYPMDWNIVVEEFLARGNPATTSGKWQVFVESSDLKGGVRGGIVWINPGQMQKPMRMHNVGDNSIAANYWDIESSLIIEKIINSFRNIK